MTIREELEQKLNKELDYQKYHYLVKSIISNHWEGKKLNIRFHKQVEALLDPGALSNLDLDRRDFGMSYLSIWNVKEFPTYNDRLRLFLGYSNDINKYSSNIFAERDKCHGLSSIERSNKLKVLLMTGYPETAERFIHEYKEELKKLKEEIEKFDESISTIIERRVKEDAS